MAGRNYRVLTPLAIVRDREGRMVHVYQGGPVSADVYDPDNIDALVDAGILGSDDDLVEVLVPETVPPGADVAPADDTDEDTEPTTVPEILDAVGDDPMAARRFLAREEAAGSPRKSLVEKLRPIAEQPGTADEVLEHVGDDQATAQEYLTREEARPDGGRSTLLEKLRPIANPPA